MFRNLLIPRFVTTHCESVAGPRLVGSQGAQANCGSEETGAFCSHFGYNKTPLGAAVPGLSFFSWPDGAKPTRLDP